MAEDDQQEIQSTDEDRVSPGEIQQSRVRIKSVGKNVSLQGSIYAHVNFYIRKSRKYIPYRRLRTFLYFYYMPYAYAALVFPGSLLGFHFATGLILSQIHLCFFLVYCQHLHILVWTLRYVMMQQTEPDHTMNSANEHIVIDMYRMQYAATSRAGIGLTTHDSGKIELQVFRQSAKDRMCRVSLMSLGGLLASFVMWVVFTIVGVTLLVRE